MQAILLRQKQDKTGTNSLNGFNYAEEKKCLLNNPIIAAELGLKFYASAPLITPDGFEIRVLAHS